MIGFIVGGIITFIYGYACVKLLIKTNNIFEKIIFGIVSSLGLIILIFYLIDSNNIMTVLGWNNNIDTTNWFNFLSQMISSFLGVLISVFIAFYQISKENEENIKRDKENLRIQNLPIIKYEINSRINSNHDVLLDDFSVNTKYNNAESAKPYDFEIVIRNIGLNNIRKVQLELSGDSFDKKTELLGYDSLIPLEKEKEECICKYLKLLANNEYVFTLKALYEDILQNKYEQEVDIKYKTTDIFVDNKPVGKIDFKVKEEVLL